MSSSNDKFPDPWEQPEEPNQPETTGGKPDLSSSSDAIESDEYGLDALQDLLNETASEPVQGEIPRSGTNEDFDQLLSSLGVGSSSTFSANEPDPSQLIADLQAMADQRSEISEPVEVSPPIESTPPLSGDVSPPTEPVIPLSSDAATPELPDLAGTSQDLSLEQLGAEIDSIANIEPQVLNSVDFSNSGDSLGLDESFSAAPGDAIASNVENIAEPELSDTLAPEISPSIDFSPAGAGTNSPPDAVSDDESSLTGSGLSDLSPSAPNPSIPFTGESSVAMGRASSATPASDNVSTSSGSVAAGSGSKAPSVGTSSSASSTNARPTYQQRLGNRQQITAFGIILAGMAGIVGYGWNQAGLDNPLKAGFKEPILGVLVDRDDDEEEPQTSSETSDPIAKQASEDLVVASDSLVNQSGDDNANSSSIEPRVSLALSDDEASEGLTSDGVESSNDDGNDDPISSLDISDVPPEHWAYPYVVAMHEQGIIPDFPDGKFQPDKPVTRAELAASLQRAFQDNPQSQNITFKDVPEGFWATDGIAHVVNTGFMSGYSPDQFAPDEQISRYQVLVSLVSGLDLTKIEDPLQAQALLEQFPDTQTMPEWALGQVAASKKANLIIQGSDPTLTLAPLRPATRAEVNAMIYQALVNTGKIEDTVRQKT